MTFKSCYCFAVCVAVKSVLSKLTADVSDQKPAYHLTPSNGHWINDPNGPIYYDNLFHLFAQYNPNGPNWGDMSWVHWISSDGVFWSENGVAIVNDETYDKGGCFSGSIIPVNNVPTLFYTCVETNDVESQCSAVPTVSAKDDPKLTKWTKNPLNPIIPVTSLTSEGVDPLNFRDPAPWVEPTQQKVYMATAANKNGVGSVLLFETALTDSQNGWKYKSALWSSENLNSTDHASMVECPDFYTALGEEAAAADASTLYILKFSIMDERRELYEVGTYDAASGRFTRSATQFPQRLEYDYGPNNHFYASKSFQVTPKTAGMEPQHAIM